MPLATLAQTKTKLQIPQADTIEDQAIQAVLSAAEAYVLKQTGFSLSQMSAEEIFRGVRTGHLIFLRQRPVSNAMAQGRQRGSTWVDVAIDIIDAREGIVALPGARWPPAIYPREQVWDVLKISYVVSPLDPIPPDLSDATAALAAYWYRQQEIGPVTDSAIGEVRESFADSPIPPAIEIVLVQYIRGRCLWQ